MSQDAARVLGEEIGGGYVERSSEAVDDLESRIPLAALDTGNVRAVEVRAVGEIFL